MLDRLKDIQNKLLRKKRLEVERDKLLNKGIGSIYKIIIFIFSIFILYPLFPIFKTGSYKVISNNLHTISVRLISCILFILIASGICIYFNILRKNEIKKEYEMKISSIEYSIKIKSEEKPFDVPSDYRNLDAIGALIKFITNKRAHSLEEAIHLYENEKYINSGLNELKNLRKL